MIGEKGCFLLFNMIGSREALLSLRSDWSKAAFPFSNLVCRMVAFIFSIWLASGGASLSSFWLVEAHFPLCNVFNSSLQYDWFADGWRFLIFNLIGWGAASLLAIWLDEGMTPILHLLKMSFFICNRVGCVDTPSSISAFYLRIALDKLLLIFYLQ